jgi:tRNA(adenine34) deaminase
MMQLGHGCATDELAEGRDSNAILQFRGLTTGLSAVWDPGLAEGEGFEPSMRFHIRAFQARALGQTMRPLRRMGILEKGDPIVNADTAMQVALDEATAASEHGDVPIGAVLLDASGEIVTRDHNRREELGDATAHAEMLVISKRSRELTDWHLTGHTLVVTIEPCAMCAMAAVWARIDRIVYGAPDLKTGAAWSLFNIPQDERLNHRIDLVQGIRAAECSALLESFFTEKRRSGLAPDA